MGIGVSDGTNYADMGEWVAHTTSGVPINPESGRPRVNITKDEDPLNYTGNYNTSLSPTEQADYDTKFSKGDSYDYDMQGWYKANPDVSPNAEGVHYPDTFKKPNHPTFSDQSQYATDEFQPGSWGNENGKDTFTPGGTNLMLHGSEKLQQYFQKTEPNVDLRMPLGASGKPAGALKPDGGSQVPGNGLKAENEVDWSKLNEVFGSIKGTAPEDTPVVFKTPYLDITEGDIERGMNVGMGTGPGTFGGVKSGIMNGKLSDLGHAQV